MITLRHCGGHSTGTLNKAASGSLEAFCGVACETLAVEIERGLKRDLEAPAGAPDCVF